MVALIQVYLNLGSNVERERYLTAGLAELRASFSDVRVSTVFESAAVGFVGDAFWNLGVALQTDWPLAELAAWLRQVEYDHGRPQHATRFSARTLDIDIVSYSDLVGEFNGVVLPRPELTENAFVLAPMAELAPTSEHPVLGVSYHELWERYDKSNQPLKIVAVNLR